MFKIIRFLFGIVLITYLVEYVSDMWFHFSVFDMISFSKNSVGFFVIQSIVALSGVFLVFSGVKILFFQKLQSFFSRTSSKVDDAIFAFFQKLYSFLQYLISFYVAFRIFPFEDVEVTKKINSIFLFLGILGIIQIVTFFIRILFDTVFPKITKNTEVSKQVFPLLKKTSIAVFWAIGVIFMLDTVGFDVGALIAGAGIGGFAIAMASKQTISNIFGAVSILINKPFKVGDFVRIDGVLGAVKEIGMTYTCLQDKYGQMVFIPNEKIISANVENFGKRKQIRGEGVIGLTYDTTSKNIEKAVQVVKDILKKYEEEGNIKDTRVHFDTFGDFSVNIGYNYNTTFGAYMDFLDMREKINLELKSTFDKKGYDFAFPTQEVIVQNKK